MKELATYKKHRWNLLVSSLLEYNIQSFSSNSDINLLNEVYLLNQSNTPEVGNLESVDHLQSLLQMSVLNLFVSNNKEMMGFIICFRENTNYSSKNYKFFSEREKKFLYIDRVAIADKYRRKGLGKNLYNKLGNLCIENKMPLCCEVNTFPMNKPSINFHKNLGFIEVGNMTFTQNKGSRSGKGSVVYLKKDISK